MNAGQDRKFFTYVGMSYGVLALIWIGVTSLLSVLAVHLNPALQGDALARILVSDAALYLLAMPVCFLLMKRIPKVRLHKNILKFGHWLIYLIIAFFIMYAGNIIGMLVNSLISKAVGHDVTPDLQETIMNLPLGWIFLLVVIAAPILEELVFRKLLIDRVIVYGDKAAIILSGLLFGLFHGNFSQFFYAFGLGMLLAYIYIRYGKVKYNIAIHMVVNFFGGILATLLVKNMGMEAIMQDPTDTNAMMEAVFEHLGAWMGMIFFGLFILAMMIAGLVLFIVKFRHAKLLPGERTLSGKQQLSVMLLNLGMLLFYVVMGYMFVQGIL